MPTTKMEVTALLKQDHEKVKALLKKLQKSTEKGANGRARLLQQVQTELEVHMRFEEEVFYPAFRAAVDSKDGEKMYFEAVEEHRAATMVLNDSLRADPGSPSFAGKVKVLAELVLHHAQEEEKEMFPKARKALSLPERRELAEQLQQMKQGALAGAA